MRRGEPTPALQFGKLIVTRVTRTFCARVTPAEPSAPARPDLVSAGQQRPELPGLPNQLGGLARRDLLAGLAFDLVDERGQIAASNGGPTRGVRRERIVEQRPD